MAQMTRDEMAKVLDEGGSVFYRDKAGALHLIARHDQLPSEADIAAKSGDAKKKAAARAALLESIAAQQEQLAVLDEPEETREEPARPAAKAEPARPVPAPVAPVAPAKAPEVKK